MRRVLAAPFRWWSSLEPGERVLYRAAVLLAAGTGLIYAPLTLIVPGLLFVLVFFGFSFRRSA